MTIILEFSKKWGILILIVLVLMIFMNTCGVKGKVERVDKKVLSIESNINYRDSLNREINSIEREISNLEVAREIVYTNNAIVRTAERPDDVMNKYNTKIKELTIKLNKLKDAAKQ